YESYGFFNHERHEINESLLYLRSFSSFFVSFLVESLKFFETFELSLISWRGQSPYRIRANSLDFPHLLLA
ncbi:MAG: hypothetical protein CMI15_10690, partial [Opitutaceae bacterium]|nr:hypothetical protein [Opitutaceae bacterium]